MTDVPVPEICVRDLEHFASYEKVEMALLASRGTCGRLVCLSAEPGSGRHEAMAWVENRASARGVTCVCRDLRDLSPVAAVERVVRAVRIAISKEGDALLEFEGIPASDENIVSRIVRALRRASVSGVPVLFSINPEAGQIVEELPECVVLSAQELALRVVDDKDGRTRSLMGLSRGLPSLLRPLVGPLHDASQGTVVPGSPYYEALSQLARQSVRPTLSDEERRIRLAMLLIGKGSTADLEGVVGGPVSEVLEGMIDRAPLFGVASRSKSFDCLTGVSTEALSACMHRLEGFCALFPAVPAACFELLTERGELSRAAVVGTVAECREVLHATCSKEADFLDAGEIALVRRALSTFPKDEREKTEAAVGLRALASRGPIESFERGGNEPDAADSSVSLLVDARRFLGGLPPLSRGEECAQGNLGKRLWSHLCACDLMLRGKFATATRVAITAPRDCLGASVSVELLDLDLEVARLMSGDALSQAKREEAAAYPLLAGGSVPGLSGYLAVAGLLRGIIVGDSVSCQAEAIAARAERSGEVVVQAIALLAGSICDLCDRMTARGRVRAQLASSVSSNASLDYLERIARLLVEMASFLMGEKTIPLGELKNDDLGLVCSLIEEAMSAEDVSFAGKVVSERVPWDALWLLRIASNGLGPLSELVDERMPPAWRRALCSMDAAQKERDPEPKLAKDISGAAEEGRGRPPIEVSMLGEFAVRVRGVRIPDWKLERRNARSMLQYMVLERGSNLKRFRLVDQVWPDCDYVTGFNRAYQATSVLRKAIAEIDSTIDPFVTSRTSKEVMLDMGLVACDVDEFRRVAREASDGDDDETTLRLARRAEQLYEGDLCLPPMDATGYVAAVRANLRELYADAMVAGAAAALRLGQSRTAGRLAHNALIANDLREDAMAVLVRALRDSGRSCEAAQRYEAFSARLSNRGAPDVPKILVDAASGLAERGVERGGGAVQ